VVQLRWSAPIGWLSASSISILDREIQSQGPRQDMSIHKKMPERLWNVSV
jgi:hypothetical protein